MAPGPCWSRREGGVGGRRRGQAHPTETDRPRAVGRPRRRHEHDSPPSPRLTTSPFPRMEALEPSFNPDWAVVATGVSAQQSAVDAQSLREDTWALQFAIAQNLTLGSFSGGGISAKHHRAPGRAFRYGVSFASGYASGRDGQPDRTDAMIRLVTHFLRYPTLASDPYGDLHMYWGIGPLVGFEARRINVPDGDGDSFRQFSLGVGGTIGAEWFVRPRISLSAEYPSAITAVLASDPSPTEWGVRLAQDGVRFGVSEYLGSRSEGGRVTSQ